MHQSDTAPTVNISDQSIHLRLVTSGEDAFAPLAPSSAGGASLTRHLDRLEAVAHRWLIARSIALLRLSLGAFFLVYGVLKIFPGVSPAQGLLEATTHRHPRTGPRTGRARRRHGARVRDRRVRHQWTRAARDDLPAGDPARGHVCRPSSCSCRGCSAARIRPRRSRASPCSRMSSSSPRRSCWQPRFAVPDSPTTSRPSRARSRPRQRQRRLTWCKPNDFRPGCTRLRVMAPGGASEYRCAPRALVVQTSAMSYVVSASSFTQDSDPSPITEELVLHEYLQHRSRQRRI